MSRVQVLGILQLRLAVARLLRGDLGQRVALWQTRASQPPAQTHPQASQERPGRNPSPQLDRSRARPRSEPEREALRVEVAGLKRRLEAESAHRAELQEQRKSSKREAEAADRRAEKAIEELGGLRDQMALQQSESIQAVEQIARQMAIENAGEAARRAAQRARLVLAGLVRSRLYTLVLAWRASAAAGRLAAVREQAQCTLDLQAVVHSEAAVATEAELTGLRKKLRRQEASQAAWVGGKAAARLRLVLSQQLRGGLAARLVVWQTAAVRELAKQRQECWRLEQVLAVKAVAGRQFRLALARLMTGQLSLRLASWLMCARDSQRFLQHQAIAELETTSSVSMKMVGVKQLRLTLARMIRGELGMRLVVWRGGVGKDVPFKVKRMGLRQLRLVLAQISMGKLRQRLVVWRAAISERQTLQEQEQLAEVDTAHVMLQVQLGFAQKRRQQEAEQVAAERAGMQAKIEELTSQLAATATELERTQRDGEGGKAVQRTQRALDASNAALEMIGNEMASMQTAVQKSAEQVKSVALGQIKHQLARRLKGQLGVRLLIWRTAARAELTVHRLAASELKLRLGRRGPESSMELESRLRGRIALSSEPAGLIKLSPSPSKRSARPPLPERAASPAAMLKSRLAGKASPGATTEPERATSPATILKSRHERDKSPAATTELERAASPAAMLKSRLERDTSQKLKALRQEVRRAALKQDPREASVDIELLDWDLRLAAGQEMAGRSRAAGMRQIRLAMGRMQRGVISTLLMVWRNAISKCERWRQMRQEEGAYLMAMEVTPQVTSTPKKNSTAGDDSWATDVFAVPTSTPMIGVVRRTPIENDNSDGVVRRTRLTLAQEPDIEYIDEEDAADALAASQLPSDLETATDEATEYLDDEDADEPPKSTGGSSADPESSHTLTELEHMQRGVQWRAGLGVQSVSAESADDSTNHETNGSLEDLLGFFTAELSQKRHLECAQRGTGMRMLRRRLADLMLGKLGQKVQHWKESVRQERLLAVEQRERGLAKQLDRTQIELLSAKRELKVDREVATLSTKLDRELNRADSAAKEAKPLPGLKVRKGAFAHRNERLAKTQSMSSK